MVQIKTLNNIASIGLDLLDKEKYLVGEMCEQPEGILLRSYNMHEMELPASLKAVARAGAGVNNIPIDKCSEKGIVVFNTPGANANAVKELVIAALLLSSRKIVDGIQWAKTLIGQGENVGKLVEKGKAEFAGPELLGKKLGVIGLGAIGVMVANAANSLKMEVEGLDPYISVDAAWGLSRNIKKASDLKSILENADYLTLHIPLNNDTRNMFNYELFSQMKKGIRILNFSRGELVNNADLKRAIDEGIVACYVTDFPEEDLLKMDNVIAIPHLGASTPESEDNCAVMAVNQLQDYLESGNIVNSVNFPNCELNRSAGCRIAVAHKNIPNMVGQITSDVAKASINIENMINKSKGNLAYTIMDAEGDVPNDLITQLCAIEGVLSVRLI